MLTTRAATLWALGLAALLATLLQAVIDPAIENFASACVVLVSTLGMLLYVGWTRALYEQPLSTLALLGFCITTQLGALLAQTLSWTAVGSSLYDPLRTFTTLAFYQALAVVTHLAYRHLLVRRYARHRPLRDLFAWAGLYRRPDARALWVLGFIGIFSFWLAGRPGVVGKLGHALTFMTWAPFLIPLYLRQVGPAYANAARSRVALLLYFMVVIAIGLALNVRQIMFYGVLNIGLFYLLVVLASDAPVSGLMVKRLAAGAAAMAVLAGPVADLATAMVVARAERDKASATQMIQRTIEVWRTPHLIEAYRAYERAQSFYGAYDEAYLESPLASRFVETKFHDNALHFASLLQNDDSREQLRRMTVESFWATLPTPLLRSLGIGINKAELEFSLGDYLVYLARGLPLGGYKIGSVFAHGQLLFGIAFPLVYVLLCLLLFSFMSLLTVQQDDGTARVTTLACMRLWAFFFYGITAEGLRPLFSFITRDFIQMAILYCIIYSLVRVVVREREGAAAPVPA